jgi:ATP-dependent Clp protease ATP-binding subunit ClpA
MMLERFTPDARAVIKNAVEHAGRLGHRYVGGEHLLLAASQPARSSARTASRQSGSRARSSGG